MISHSSVFFCAQYHRSIQAVYMVKNGLYVYCWSGQNAVH